MLNRLCYQLRHYIRAAKTTTTKQELLNNDMSNLVPVSEDAVDIAVKFLRKGELIALPTDTVYGLAADTQNTNAIKKLYQVKGRHFNKPIAICINKVEDINLWGVTNSVPSELLNALLPGPVTILLERTNGLNGNLNPGIDKIGIRIPNSDFIRKIIEKFDSAIALTSANLSNEPSTLYPDEFRPLWPLVGAVFDGGNIEGSNSRAGSTIIDLSSKGTYKIVREGSALNNTISILHEYGLKKNRI